MDQPVSCSIYDGAWLSCTCIEIEVNVYWRTVSSSEVLILYSPFTLATSAAMSNADFPEPIIVTCFPLTTQAHLPEFWGYLGFHYAFQCTGWENPLEKPVKGDCTRSVVIWCSSLFHMLDKNLVAVFLDFFLERCFWILFRMMFLGFFFSKEFQPHRFSSCAPI
jgi:hypothetical protein